jgi:hypothetical protein
VAGLVYLLNTIIVPADVDSGPKTVRLRKISATEAKDILSRGYTSAVGHEGTATVLSQVLGMQVPANRVAIRMGKGDKAVHFALKTRLPEGAVLSADELSRLDFDLLLSEVD